MSYQKFTQALNDYDVYLDKHNLPSPEMDEALALVRDAWIRDGRYKELVAFTLENWDSGNCDDFSRPLSLHLLELKERTLFLRLWKGILRNRLEKLWRDVGKLKLKHPNMSVDKIRRINTKNYNQFSSTESIERSVAWRRLYIIDGINEFIVGLRALNETQEIEKQTKLLDIVSNLEKPTPQPTTDKRKIDEKLFWNLIDDARSISRDQFHFIDNLQLSLERFHPNEIRNFEKNLLNKINELNTWENWALAYIVRGGCGDDAFDYFKAWVVSKGQKAYEAIKNMEEDKLVSLFDEDPQLEELYYLAGKTYESKTSEFMPPVKVKSSKLTGKRWEEDKLAETYPSLAKLFNYEKINLRNQPFH